MKISIITATLNNKAGLIRAIESVRSQTYKNIEHIIVDGGSRDGSLEILRQAQDDKSLYTNYSLIAISEADSGIYDAINKGIKLASGDVIGLLHSDDFFADDFVLEKYAEVFEQSSENIEHKPFDSAQGDKVDAVYSDLVYVREKSKVKSQKSKVGVDEQSDNYPQITDYSVIRTWKTHRIENRGLRLVNSMEIPKQVRDDNYSSLITDHLLLNGWMPPHPTLFIKKEVFEKFGLYRTDMNISADYEMILRLFYKYKITSLYLPETTYCMTIGGASNKSIRNIYIKSSEDYRAMKIHSLPFPFKTLLMKNLRKLPQFFNIG